MFPAGSRPIDNKKSGFLARRDKTRTLPTLRTLRAGPRPDESACDVGCKPRNNVANQHERGVYLPRKCPYQPLKLLAKVEDTQAKPAKKPHSLAHSRHKMSLTTVGRLLERADTHLPDVINGRITAELASKMMGMLDRIRTTIKALPPEPQILGSGLGHINPREDRHDQDPPEQIPEHYPLPQRGSARSHDAFAGRDELRYTDSHRRHGLEPPFEKLKI